MDQASDRVNRFHLHCRTALNRLTALHGVHPERVGVILLFAVLSLWVLWLWKATGMASPRPVFPTDDAYITLHNALVLAGLQTEHFVSAGPWSGVTSLLHTLFVAGLVRFLSPEISLSVAGLFGALLYVGGLIAIGRRAGLGIVATGVLAYLGLACGYMPHHLSNGLETSWALAAVSWTLFLLMSIPRHGSWLAVMLAILPLVRPELAILSALSAVYWLWTIRHDRIALRHALWWLGGCGVVVLAFVLWLGWGPIPNTVFAKKYFYASWCSPLEQKLFLVNETTSRYLLPYGALLVGLAGWWRDRIGMVLTGFTVLLVTAYWTSHAGAMAYYEGRYLAPLVPMLVFGLIRLSSSLGPLALRERVVLALLLCLYPALFSTPSAIDFSRRVRAYTVSELMPLAEWVKHNVPADSRILVHDIGYLAYAIHQPLVDMVGLKSDTAMRLHRQASWPSCGGARPAAIAGLALQERPAYLITLEPWDRVFRIREGLRQVATLKQLRESEKGYVVYSIAYRNGAER